MSRRLFLMERSALEHDWAPREIVPEARSRDQPVVSACAQSLRRGSYANPSAGGPEGRIGEAPVLRLSYVALILAPHVRMHDPAGFAESRLPAETGT
jgi:hypothetical protein